MAQVKAMLSITIPGSLNEAQVSPLLKRLCWILAAHGIEHQWVDTISGWWNLNQDWVQFEAMVDTSWEWVLPLNLREEHRKFLHRCLEHGNLIMVVHYLDEKGGLVPHN